MWHGSRTRLVPKTLAENKPPGPGQGKIVLLIASLGTHWFGLGARCTVCQVLWLVVGPQATGDRYSQVLVDCAGFIADILQSSDLDSTCIIDDRSGLGSRSFGLRTPKGQKSRAWVNREVHQMVKSDNGVRKDWQ